MIRWFIDWWKKRKTDVLREWAHVPPPEWKAKRGWREYW